MYQSNSDLLHVLEQAERQKQTIIEDEDDSASPWSYHMKLGRGTIWLDAIEYRIFSLLASRPYKAFSTPRIAAAVSTDRHPVTAETLREHITSLRNKLGFFADYIQSVPYIGYRFRA